MKKNINFISPLPKCFIAKYIDIKLVSLQALKFIKFYNYRNV